MQKHTYHFLLKNSSERDLYSRISNKLYYYIKLSDELIRFSKIRKYIFTPKSFLSFQHVKYKINKDEIVLLEELFENYFDNIILQNSEWKNIPGLLSCADVMLSLIKPTFAKIASSPTKVAEGFALGKPLLCNNGIGDLDWIVNDNNLGYVFDINNLSKLDNIDNVIDQLLKISTDKIINQSKEIYDLKIAKQNYKKIYERIV